MAFQHVILIAAILLSNGVSSALKCPYHLNKTNPDVTERNFLGIWYPQYLITDYEASAEDVDRFACTKYNVVKSNTSNNYEMQLKTFDPRFKDDKKANVFTQLRPVISEEFGSFWFDLQKIYGKDMWTSTMHILDIFDGGRYMIILGCSHVRPLRKFNGFVLHRGPLMWYKYSAAQYQNASMELDKTLKKYLVSLSDGDYEFRTARLTQNVEICQQFNSTFSGSRNLLFSLSYALY